jgi:hypothetical protein
MNHNHITQEDASNLIRYLREVDLDEGLKLLGQIFSSGQGYARRISMQNLSILDRVITERNDFIRNYETRNPFGKTRQEIEDNAKKALRDCKPCCQVYERYIRHLANAALWGTDDDIAEQDPTDEEIEARMRQIDKLGVIN